MPLISFVIATMGRLKFIKQTLEPVLKQTDSEVILVDWSCPENSGDWAEKEYGNRYHNLKVVRVQDKIYYNASISRNIGAKNSSGTFLCFLDCDVILEENFIDVCLPFLDSESYIIFDKYGSGHTGMIILPKITFEKIGGYNETFEGYGYEDIDLRKRTAKILLKVYIPNTLAKHIDHGDEDRVKYHMEKNKLVSDSRNREISYSSGS